MPWGILLGVQCLGGAELGVWSLGDGGSSTELGVQSFAYRASCQGVLGHGAWDTELWVRSFGYGALGTELGVTELAVRSFGSRSLGYGALGTELGVTELGVRYLRLSCLGYRVHHLQKGSELQSSAIANSLSAVRVHFFCENNPQHQCVRRRLSQVELKCIMNVLKNV